MLALIALVVVGVALIGLALAVLRRPRRAHKLREPGSVGGESEVYERLYGKRSMTVSAPVPAERPPDADLESSQASPSE